MGKGDEASFLITKLSYNITWPWAGARVVFMPESSSARATAWLQAVAVLFATRAARYDKGLVGRQKIVH